tara:strand:- start:797 stop:922 length:126 start_codon:yes stop_codon:yes gene_type:complete
MVKSYEKQAKSKADIAKENREKNLERLQVGEESTQVKARIK